MDHKNDDDLEEYGDENIASRNAPVPKFLSISYVVWIVFGLCWFYFFCNGSMGWLDRGYWQQLQRAAITTYPFQIGINDVPPKDEVNTNGL